MTTYDQWKLDSDEPQGPICHCCKRGDVELSHGGALWRCSARNQRRYRPNHTWSDTAMIKELVVTMCFWGTPVAIDGDTAEVCGVRMRFDDFDTAELYHPRCQRELELARRARDELARRLPTLSYHPVPCMFQQNYGRICIHAEGLAEHMIKLGVAVKFPLGHKPNWC